jgi:hypothetical protein
MRLAITFDDELHELTREHGLRVLAERALAASPEHRQRIRLAIEPAVGPDLVRRDHIEALLVELLARVDCDVLRLGCEPDCKRRLRQRRHACESVRRAYERQLEIFRVTFYLLPGRGLRPIVRHGGAGDEKVGARDLGMHRFVHFLRGLHVDTAHAGRRS